MTKPMGTFIEKEQENCPYCHHPYKPFISTGIETDLDLGSSNGPVYEEEE